VQVQELVVGDAVPSRGVRAEVQAPRAADQCRGLQGGQLLEPARHDVLLLDGVVEQHQRTQQAKKSRHSVRA